MEIERKYLVRTLPENLDSFTHAEIEQAYISRDPVIRIRKKNDQYILTIKGHGLLEREEHELLLSEESYLNLKKKTEGKVVSKTRYFIPYKNLTIEFDVFHGHMEGLLMAEVEFSSVEESESFEKPDWFFDEVTFDRRFHNVNMAFEQ